MSPVPPTPPTPPKSPRPMSLREAEAFQRGADEAKADILGAMGLTAAIYRENGQTEWARAVEGVAKYVAVTSFPYVPATAL